MTPKNIYSHLGQYVIGQDKAKKVLSVVASRHSRPHGGGDEFRRSVVLITGPTGVGKTLTASTLAEYLNIPFGYVSAANATAIGFVGDDITECVMRLRESAIRKGANTTDNGIIFIDEIDKIKRAEDKFNKDINGLEVQHNLLTLLEAKQVNAKVGALGNATEPVSLRNVMFVCAGAFNGLPKDFTTKDLINFGLIPELVGRRFTNIVSLDQLTVGDMVRIITEPKNSVLKRHMEFFKEQGSSLTLHPEGALFLANEAIRLGLGARGISRMMEDLLLDTYFNLPEKPGKYSITSSGVVGPEEQIKDPLHETKRRLRSTKRNEYAW